MPTIALSMSAFSVSYFIPAEQRECRARRDMEHQQLPVQRQHSNQRDRIVSSGTCDPRNQAGADIVERLSDAPRQDIGRDAGSWPACSRAKNSRWLGMHPLMNMRSAIASWMRTNASISTCVLLSLRNTSAA